MPEKYLMLVFNLFQNRITEISCKYGMGAAYIKGQLDEALHQLKISSRK